MSNLPLEFFRDKEALGDLGFGGKRWLQFVLGFAVLAAVIAASYFAGTVLAPQAGDSGLGQTLRPFVALTVLLVLAAASITVSWQVIRRRKRRNNGKKVLIRADLLPVVIGVAIAAAFWFYIKWLVPSPC